jgi:hypothetical protein
VAKVYIIFDPVGIWESGPAVFEREEDAVMQAAEYIPSYPGYSLEVRAFDVVPAVVRG